MPVRISLARTSPRRSMTRSAKRGFGTNPPLATVAATCAMPNGDVWIDPLTEAGARAVAGRREPFSELRRRAPSLVREAPGPSCARCRRSLGPPVASDEGRVAGVLVEAHRLRRRVQTLLADVHGDLGERRVARDAQRVRERTPAGAIAVVVDREPACLTGRQVRRAARSCRCPGCTCRTRVPPPRSRP